MENITVIIPIHKIDGETVKYTQKAVESVLEQGLKEENILFVGPKEVQKTLTENEVGKSSKFLLNEKETDYCNQVNLAVKNVSTKYFSILAFDDQYTKTWFKNVEKYTKFLTDFSVFAPIVSFVDSKTSEVMGTINEIVWAMSFSNELGVIDEDALQNYYDFSTNGAVFRTDDFIEVGMLKPSIKLSFWYEFLLRATNSGLKIYVIPKNGYKQTIGLENSMVSAYDEEMDDKQRDWWIKLATKEYYFKQERKKSYQYKKEDDIENLK